MARAAGSHSRQQCPVSRCICCPHAGFLDALHTKDESEETGCTHPAHQDSHTSAGSLLQPGPLQAACTWLCGTRFVPLHHYPLCDHRSPMGFLRNRVASTAGTPYMARACHLAPQSGHSVLVHCKPSHPQLCQCWGGCQRIPSRCGPSIRSCPSLQGPVVGTRQAAHPHQTRGKGFLLGSGAASEAVPSACLSSLGCSPREPVLALPAS